MEQGSGLQEEDEKLSLSFSLIFHVLKIYSLKVWV